MQNQMARMLNLSPQSSSLHIFKAEILMSSLLTAGDSTKVYWPRMLAFCLYAQFLLVSPSGDCDSKLLHILDQVEAGSHPFLLYWQRLSLVLTTLLKPDDFLKSDAPIG